MKLTLHTISVQQTNWIISVQSVNPSVITNTTMKNFKRNGQGIESVMSQNEIRDLIPTTSVSMVSRLTHIKKCLQNKAGYVPSVINLKVLVVKVTSFLWRLTTAIRQEKYGAYSAIGVIEYSHCLMMISK